jgi:hypothetical protein
MDIVEFAEKFMHVELLEYQKTFLREFDKLRGSGKVRIVTGGDGRSYIYLDRQTQKELTQNGTTINSAR